MESKDGDEKKGIHVCTEQELQRHKRHYNQAAARFRDRVEALIAKAVAQVH